MTLPAGLNSGGRVGTGQEVLKTSRVGEPGHPKSDPTQPLPDREVWAVTREQPRIYLPLLP